MEAWYDSPFSAAESMLTGLLIAVLILSACSVALCIALWLKGSNSPDSQAAIASLGQTVQSLERSLSEKFASTRTDMASRLEQTKGDLRQEVADRLTQGFDKIHAGVEEHLAAGR